MTTYQKHWKKPDDWGVAVHLDFPKDEYSKKTSAMKEARAIAKEQKYGQVDFMGGQSEIWLIRLTAKKREKPKMSEEEREVREELRKYQFIGQGSKIIALRERLWDIIEAKRSKINKTNK